MAIGIITESSELLEHFRFKSESEMREMLKNPQKRAEISDELVDILYFVLRFSQMNGIDLVEALNRKMEKNKRRYPVEKAKGSNKKYVEFD